MTSALGEIMLRLKAPDRERFFQSPTLEATFGGGEANVLMALAQLGDDAGFISVLPEGPLGEGALAALRQVGVNTSQVLRRPGRMGIYFLEAGAAQRPSKVIYDRADTPIARATFDDWNWDAVFQDRQWFHLTGITPALSPQAQTLALAVTAEAHRRGLSLSLDLNYRKNLWQYGQRAEEVMPAFVRQVQVLIANEEDLQKSLGLPLHSHLQAAKGEIDLEAYRELGQRVLGLYPNLKFLAITLRESLNADHNRWSGLLFSPTAFFQSRVYDIYPIVDRVGGGDAFAAGLIHALTRNYSAQRSLDFAVALSCLKHSIPGDQVRVSLAEVEALLAGDDSGRVQR